MQLGSALDFVGDSKEAVSVIEVTSDLNPQSLDQYGAIYIIARSYLHQGDFERAIAYARRALNLRPTFHHAYVVLVASLAHAGRDDEAKEALARGREARPDFGRAVDRMAALCARGAEEARDRRPAQGRLAGRAGLISLGGPLSRRVPIDQFSVMMARSALPRSPAQGRQR